MKEHDQKLPLMNCCETDQLSTAGPQTIKWALFSLHGRIRRSTFVWSSLFLFVLAWVALAQFVFAIPESAQQVFWALCFSTILLVSAYCLFALAVKRIHDLGYSGWWILLGVVTTLYGIGFILLCFWPGQRNDNAYGPPPVTGNG